MRQCTLALLLYIAHSDRAPWLASVASTLVHGASSLPSESCKCTRSTTVTHSPHKKKKWCNCHTKKKAGGRQSLSLPSWLNPLFVVCKIRCISFEFTPFLMWSAYLASVHSDELCCFVSCPLQLPLPFFFFFSETHLKVVAFS